MNAVLVVTWPVPTPHDHCFREDNCAAHQGADTGHLCCCCGWPADAHTGCDCEPDEG